MHDWSPTANGSRSSGPYHRASALQPLSSFCPLVVLDDKLKVEGPALGDLWRTTSRGGWKTSWSQKATCQPGTSYVHTLRVGAEHSRSLDAFVPLRAHQGPRLATQGCAVEKCGRILAPGRLDPDAPAPGPGPRHPEACSPGGLQVVLRCGRAAGCREGGMPGCRGGGMSGCREGGMPGCRGGGMSGCREGGMPGCRGGDAAKRERLDGLDGRRRRTRRTHGLASASNGDPARSGRRPSPVRREGRR